MAVMIAAGISRQEHVIKRLQTFSHSQRPRKRMGKVKLPFMRPDKIASSEPASTMFPIFFRPFRPKATQKSIPISNRYPEMLRINLLGYTIIQ